MTSPSREPLSNYPENQFSTKEKTPSIAAKPHFSNRAYWKHWSQRHATLRDFPDVTCSSCIGLKLRNYMSCSNKRGLQLQALGFRVQHKKNLIKRFSVFISMYKLFSQNKQKKNNGISMSWSNSCQHWNTGMAPVSGRPPNDFFIAGISQNRKDSAFSSLCN